LSAYALMSNESCAAVVKPNLSSKRTASMGDPR
jgi:hypothetical protein